MALTPGDEVIVILDTVDLESPDEVPVVKGEFGRVLSLMGHYVRIALDAQDEPRTVLVPRNAVEDMDAYRIRRAIRRDR